MKMRPLQRRLIRAAGLLAAAALFASACSSGESEILTYTDPDRLARFEIPSSWQLYDQEDLAGVSEVPFVVQYQDFNLPVISRVAFEGSTVRDVDKLGQPISVADFPVGSVVVRTIGADEKDNLSRRLLAQAVVPYQSQEVFRELLKTDIEVGPEFQGVQVEVLFTDTVTEQNAGVHLIAITDPDVTRMYSIAVGCSLDCFQLYRNDIVTIVDSWLVNTR